MFPEGMDMNALLAQAQQMQAQLAETQQQLAATEFSGTAGGGLVEATLTGDGELTALAIKPEACDPEDTESLADLVIAAVRDAKAKVDAETQSKLGGMAQGLGF